MAGFIEKQTLDHLEQETGFEPEATCLEGKSANAR